MEKPTFDYQMGFAVTVATEDSESLQKALGLRSSACDFCGGVFPNGSMVRRDRRIFCDRLHASWYFRVRKADTLAMKGEDEAALSVKGLGDALENLQRFEPFPHLSRLLNDVEDSDGAQVNEAGVAYVQPREYGDGECLYCGAPIQRTIGRGRPSKFCEKVAHRVAYNRLKKAIAEGKVAELIAPVDDVEVDVTVQPDPEPDFVTTKRAYTKTSARWNRREFGTLDWNDPAFKTIQIFGDGPIVQAFCKCGVRFRSNFAAVVRWAETHTTVLRVHGKNMARRRDRLTIMRRARNMKNVRGWNAFVIGQQLQTMWEIN